jgi:uncharacterized membrane protein
MEMDNNQVLSFIKGKINDGTVTKEQVIGAINNISTPYSGASYVSKSVNNDISEKEVHHDKGMALNLTNILYIIGSIIAIVGVGIFVAQNWDSISFGVKIILTLGISVITFSGGMVIRNKEIKSLANVMFAVSIFSLFGTVAVLFNNWGVVPSALRVLLSLGLAVLVYILGLVFRDEQHKTLSQVMFVISTFLGPIGSYIFAYENNIKMDWSLNLTVSLTWSILYLFAYFFANKRNVLFLINIIYFSWVYMVIVRKIFDYNSSDVFLYKMSVIVLGLSYILLSYSRNGQLITDKQDGKEKKSIQNLLYLAGSIAVLGVSYTFDQSLDIFYIALLFAMFYASIFLRSTIMLLVSSGFLIAEIIRLTSRYFVNSIGWPLSLIVIGFLVIGVGYATYNLNRKFIQTNTNNAQ